MKINSKYKVIIKIIIWSITGIGIILSFVTMPPLIAAGVTIVLTIISTVLSKSEFIYKTLHVIPLHSESMLLNRIGSLWAIDEEENHLVFGQCYKTKKAAKDAYQILRKWNLMKYNVDNGEIKFSIIHEGHGKYTFLVYPTRHEYNVNELHDGIIKTEHGHNSKSKPMVLSMYDLTCVDYSKDSYKYRLVKSISDEDIIMFNTFYLKEKNPTMYAKRFIKVPVSICSRNSLDKDSLEYRLKWSDENCT